MAVMALLGVLSAAASMLLLKNAGIYKILVHLLINPLMFYFCFQQKSIREFLTDYAAGYLIMLLLGGSVEWLCRLLGQRNLLDRKSTRLNSSHKVQSRMPSSA